MDYFDDALEEEDSEVSEEAADDHSSDEEVLSLAAKRRMLAEDNYCKENISYVWCLPRDYNQEKHPFIRQSG